MILPSLAGLALKLYVYPALTCRAGFCRAFGAQPFFGAINFNAAQRPEGPSDSSPGRKSREAAQEIESPIHLKYS